MARRDTLEGYGKRVEVEEEETPSTVRLVLLINVKLNVKGPQTGVMYHFAGAGSEVDVDQSDVPGLLARTVGNTCCGGSQPAKYFQTVD
jgi:hypothetical protein